MKKVMILSSVSSMIEQFNRHNIKILQNIGFEVHVSTNFIDSGTISYEKSIQFRQELINNGVIVHQIDFSRGVSDLKSIFIASNQLKRLVMNTKFDMVHLHSPIASVVGRLVFKKYSPETKIIYTAHGFQFFEEGPKKDWILFYPIEKYLSKYTDVLITINNMDYELAKKKFHSKKIFKIPGVGINTDNENITKNKVQLRKELGVPKTAFLICSVGELSSRKNHEVIIKAIANINDPNIYYVICGVGQKYDYLKELISKYKLNNRVFLLGYRDDRIDIMNASDVVAFPSRREGLGLAGLEAFSVGTPLISSNVQGIRDYQEHGKTGYISKNNSEEDYLTYIKKLKEMSKTEKDVISKYNLSKVKKYDNKNVDKIMEDIYRSIC